jgi:tetratricopeptide (TPR) repeat protein
MVSRKILVVLLMAIFMPWASAQQTSTGTSTSTSTSPTTQTPGPDKIYISGTVIQEDGKPAPIGTAIELDCVTSITRQADTDPNGNFSFIIGDTERRKRLQPDASIGDEDPFEPMIGADGTSTQSGTKSYIGTQSAGASPIPEATKTIYQRLANCTLRAQYSGYKSSTVNFAGKTLAPINEMGVILIYPANKFPGTVESAMSVHAPKKAKKLVDQAEKALAKNDPNEAVKQLKSAIEAYAEYAEAWFELGRIYEIQKRKDDARNALKKAIAIDSLFVKPYIQLGWLESREKKWKEVADITDKALSLDPVSFPDAYFLNSLANYNLGNIAVAERRAQIQLRLDPMHAHPQIYLVMANIAARKKNTSGYIDGLKNYLRYAPNAQDAPEVRKQLEEKLAKSSPGK